MRVRTVRIAFVFLLLALVGVSSTAIASVECLGSMTPTGSWQQAMHEHDAYSPATFDLIAVQLISGGPLGDFPNSIPPLSALSSGWVQTDASSSAAVIQGTANSDEYFTMTFLAVPVSMYFEAYDGQTVVDYGILSFSADGTNSYTDLYSSGNAPARGDVLAAAGADVPEPATLIVWSLLGGASWLGMRVWRGGRQIGRRSWSPENLQAILDVIGR